MLNNQNTKALPSSIGFIILGIIFIAANLRTPLTSVGPLVSLIRDDVHISNTLAGLITTLPLLAFALLSPLVPKLGRKYGVERIILLALIFLTIGIVIRSLSGAANLYIGTVILGFAIAICNVLLPSIIKRDFPNKIGSMTGLYSVSMCLCGAIASGISVPLAVNAGLKWQGALGIWGVLSFVAILCWLPQLRNQSKQTVTTSQQRASNDVNVWRSPLAWQVTLFMGIQSMVFYVLIAWLPEILKQQGIDSTQSGWYLSIMQLALLPFTFIVPVIAGRMSSQRLLVVITTILLLTGTLGLLYGSSNIILLWIIILGIGVGFAFSLSMMFFGLRTENAHQAAELSGMAQSIGYLLAAIGPALIGYLHDATNSWDMPLFILLGASVLLLLAGMGAARNRFVGSGSRYELPRKGR
ncbi:MFS transporter, CP family, cyanate transporter [Paenibacillus sp. OK060]|uniref:CynX/NimT family MFS transporter n=1 Tax=unclassified Paenibacillus TaxID=185978 RepID=UPI00087FB2FF|nr:MULTISPECIES: MFS transporter [unclassified Paenibacillus]SDK50551.1 MFS transporter, CP family, cyanate transporter [Paenibacillus sp. OK060]SEA69794.1 MFS transporter, CP family, cyanate transporter [Paenibacillus sp. 276b]